MKIGKFIINILKWNSYRGAKKRRKVDKPYGRYVERIDIPYIDDGNYHHKFDVMLGIEPRKKCCLIDIHGGSYIFGEHIDQYIFGEFFLRQGYDFISADYIPNDGKRRSTKDIFDDLYQFLKYVFSHQKELGIEGDDFVITGDSAGGHMALTVSQMLMDDNYMKKLGYEPLGVRPIACLANCPVYDFVNMSGPYLKKSGQKRLLGPSYNNQSLLKLLSPREHIDSLTCPLFVSTCMHDFLRSESHLIKKDMEKRSGVFEFFDLEIDDKSVGHVHNVLYPFRPHSVTVNQAMVDFIERNRNK